MHLRLWITQSGAPQICTDRIERLSLLEWGANERCPFWDSSDQVLFIRLQCESPIASPGLRRISPSDRASRGQAVSHPKEERKKEGVAFDCIGGVVRDALCSRVSGLPRVVMGVSSGYAPVGDGEIGFRCC